MDEKRIVILGAGPTGLGAAWRLQELGYKNWAVYEKNPHVGGLAASFVDEKGFTWDVGGHVLFSHYPYFDKLIDDLLKDDYLTHRRESWIRIADRWVPYPFQNNIRYLPKDMIYACLSGLLDCHCRQDAPAEDFQTWMENTFGEGIVNYFMAPYNEKVWAYPLKEMSRDWIAERVSVVDVKRVLKNVLLERDDVDWGPNNTFRFPLKGGTGEIFRRMGLRIQGHLFLGREAGRIHLGEKSIEFSIGKNERYDLLINTLPLDTFISLCNDVPERLREEAGRLVHTSGFIVGLGFRQKIDNDRCWMYFPEPDAPFYRVTNFSNYSFNNVPGGDAERYYSLMCEASYSAHRKVDKGQIVDQTIRGLISSGMIRESDVRDIVSLYLLDVPYSYPVPTLDRDRILENVQPFLESKDVFSRGRFGGWKYEVGNMDHSTMQGVEIVDKLLLNRKEATYTFREQ